MLRSSAARAARLCWLHLCTTCYRPAVMPCRACCVVMLVACSYIVVNGTNATFESLEAKLIEVGWGGVAEAD